jgi:UDP-N-acetylglucosamine--N-acetylmuramyl-(pentapeptide) pyrophosphoryl-undecaprenol N-acetylglucosamine transferase
MIAGGGTGGHVFTGIAVARELLSRNAKDHICFVGTERGLESRLVPQAGFLLRTTPVFGLKGLGLKSKLKSLGTLPQSFFSSLKILFQEKPDLVLGVGGYASGPIILLASLLRIPTALVEQNSVPGLTNRILGRFVRKVFLAFANAQKYFPREKCVITGNPIRRELFESAQKKMKKDKNSDFSLLVFGGSQGARKIDQSLLDAAPLLKGAKFHLTHQSNGPLMEDLKKTYKQHEIDAQVVKFIDEMGQAYNQADLVICRAGAISVTEISVLGKPAVFIPFPHATDNHQEANARSLTDHGAGVLLLDRDCTGERLAQIIREFMDNPEKRKEMSQKAFHYARPRAARDIVDSCQLLAKNFIR